MPHIEVNENIYVSPIEFLEDCDSEEIDEIINWLEKERPKLFSKIFKGSSRGETYFSEKLSIIMDSFYSLSKEDEETIIKIAEKYK